jgi:hypothetical protein
MKAIFRFFLKITVWLYRRTGGKFGGRVQGLPVLLLTTVGRRTGERRVTPPGYRAYEKRTKRVIPVVLLRPALPPYQPRVINTSDRLISDLVVEDRD